MRGSATIFGLLLLVWLAGSAWWYTCKIKGTCIVFSGEKYTNANQLVIDLEGFDQQSFSLTSSGNGVMQIVPAESNKGGKGIGIIKNYLDNHPDRDIDIIAQNDNQANGLLAMLIIMGVPHDRVNLYSDKNAGNKDRPMKIVAAHKTSEFELGKDSLNIAVAEPETTAEEIPAEEQKIEQAADLISEKKDIKPEKIQPKKAVQEDVVKPVVNVRLPCPTVYTDVALPSIGDILYSTASYRLRCTVSLAKFATAAAAVIVEDNAKNIVITGHTDDDQRGSNNYQLGLKRAVEIKKYLIKKGIPGHRIETYSRGSDSPVADNSTAEGQKLNRRVSISWN